MISLLVISSSKAQYHLRLPPVALVYVDSISRVVGIKRAFVWPLFPSLIPTIQTASTNQWMFISSKTAPIAVETCAVLEGIMWNIIEILPGGKACVSRSLKTIESVSQAVLTVSAPPFYLFSRVVAVGIVTVLLNPLKKRTVTLPLSP